MKKLCTLMAYPSTYRMRINKGKEALSPRSRIWKPNHTIMHSGYPSVALLNPFYLSLSSKKKLEKFLSC